MGPWSSFVKGFFNTIKRKVTFAWIPHIKSRGLFQGCGFRLRFCRLYPHKFYNIDVHTYRPWCRVQYTGEHELLKQTINKCVIKEEARHFILMNIIARTHKNIIDRSVKSDREMLVIRLLLFKIQEYIIGRCIFHTTHAVIVQNDYRLISHKKFKNGRSCRRPVENAEIIY